MTELHTCPDASASASQLQLPTAEPSREDKNFLPSSHSLEHNVVAAQGQSLCSAVVDSQQGRLWCVYGRVCMCSLGAVQQLRVCKRFVASEPHPS